MNYNAPIRNYLKSNLPQSWLPHLRNTRDALLLRKLFIDKMTVANIWRDADYHHTLAFTKEDCEKLEKIYGIKFSYIDQELNKQIDDFADTVKYPTIIDNIEPGSRVLDLGCGPGKTLWDLKRLKNVDPCGLDVSQQSVDILNSRGIEAYRCDLSDLFDERLQWAASQKWDYVISCGGALQNFAWPTKILQIFGKTTQIHQVYNYGFWFNRLRLLFGRYTYTPTTDLLTKGHPYYSELNVFRTYWTFHDFPKICDSAGFDTERLSYNGLRIGGPSLFKHSAFFKLTPQPDFEEVTIDSVLLERNGVTKSNRLGANAW